MASAALTPYIPGQVKVGVTYIANEDRITEDGFSEPLTTYAQGWRDNSPIMEDLQSIAPSVPVARRFDYKTSPKAEAFLIDIDDIRAPMGDFKRIEYTGGEETEKTDNKGLVFRVEKGTSDKSKQRKIALTIQRLYRSELVRAGKILQGLTNGSAKVWGPDSDPDADLILGIEKSADQTGVQPNVVIFDSKAWAIRQIAHRSSDKAGGMASASLTKEQLADLLGVEKVIVLKERFTIKKGQGAKEKILSTPAVFITNIDQLAMEDDPSAIKRFVSQDGEIRVHVDDHHAKFEDITVEHYSKIIGTSGIGTIRYNVSQE